MSQATDMLAKYIDAEAKVLQGLDIRWGDRRLVMADLPSIRAGRKEWETAVAKEARVAAGAGPDNIVLADFSGGCR